MRQKLLIEIDPWFWDWFDQYKDRIQTGTFLYDGTYVNLMLAIAMEVK